MNNDLKCFGKENCQFTVCFFVKAVRAQDDKKINKFSAKKFNEYYFICGSKNVFKGFSKPLG